MHSMTYLLLVFIASLVLFVAGVAFGIFLVRGVPMRGRVSVALLILSAFLWALSEPSNMNAGERIWTIPFFTFTAPIAIIYCFRARKTTVDRLLARAAFFSSFLLALLLVFMICAISYFLFFMIFHHLLE